jgi:hypothetical protein
MKFLIDRNTGTIVPLDGDLVIVDVSKWQQLQWKKIDTSEEDLIEMAKDAPAWKFADE